MSKKKNSSQNFSLHQLNQHLRRVIGLNMRERIWIKAEIADINSSKGSWYIALVERDAMQLKARAEAIVWQRTRKQFRKKLGANMETVLAIGSQVLVYVSVEYNEFHGLKLVIHDIDQSYTIGQFEQQRLEVLQKLEEEQFIGLNAELTLPIVPQRIAVISSPQAAGLQDFRDQLVNNPYGYHFDYELFPAAVQGVNLEREIIQQLAVIEARKEDFDLIAIVRGGGAKLDLAGFNIFGLCKAIATCELPIVTGIGHEVDEVLADLVAHTSLKTPTAAADFLINQLTAFEVHINDLQLRMQQATQTQLQAQQRHLDHLAQSFKFSVQQFLTKQQRNLDHLEEKFTLLHPRKTLERGFTLLFDEDGKTVTDLASLKKDQLLKIRHKDGEILVRVDQIR